MDNLETMVLLLKKLFAAYSHKQPTDGMITVYLERLQSIPVSVLGPVIDQCLDEHKFLPTIAEIKEQAAEAQAQRELAELVDRQHAGIQHRSSASYSVSNGAKKPRPRAQPPPSYDDPWAIVVTETANQMPEGVLQRAHAESIGDLSGAEVWEVSLAMRDASHLSWMQDRGKELIRKSLSSILGRAVKVDVIIPETEVA